MAFNQGTEDPIVVYFGEDNSNITNDSDTSTPNTSYSYVLGNLTSYTIERDFFGGPNTFSIEAEDDRANQLFEFIAIGKKITFQATSGQIILVGFIDSFTFTPNRSSGTHLSVRGRDRLGMLSDSSIYPNLGSSTTTSTYQFKPTDTLLHVVGTILKSAPGITEVSIDDDHKGLTAQTGFGIGVRSQGKTGRGLKRSFNSNLNRLLKPEKGESYLTYLKRIATRAGCEVNMYPGSDNIILISPPAYDRSSPGQPNWSIIRNITTNTIANNVLESTLTVDYKDQPSIIIAESSTGGPTFKKSIKKVICINELTGYARQLNLKLSLTNAIANVQDAVDDLTSGTNGYPALTPNQDLYDSFFATNIQTSTFVSRPKYMVDNNSQTIEELQFFIAELMAHFQDRFLVLEYEVQGHSQNGHFWAPNLMVKVQDEAMSPFGGINTNLWIKRVVFTRDASNGCRTHLTLTLPYTHSYNISTNTHIVDLSQQGFIEKSDIEEV